MSCILIINFATMNKEDELYNSLAEDMVKGNSLSISADWKPWEDSHDYEYVVMFQSFEDPFIDRETFCELMEHLRRLLVVHITTSPLCVIDFDSETASDALKNFVIYVPTFGEKKFERHYGYFGMNIPKHYSPLQIIILLHRIKESVSNNYESLPMYFFKRNEERNYIMILKFADYQTVLSTVANYRDSCSLQLYLMGYSVEVARETINKVIRYIEKLQDLDYEYNAKILAEAQARGDYDDVPRKYDRDKPLSE